MRFNISKFQKFKLLNKYDSELKIISLAVKTTYEEYNYLKSNNNQEKCYFQNDNY